MGVGVSDTAPYIEDALFGIFEGIVDAQGIALGAVDDTTKSEGIELCFILGVIDDSLDLECIAVKAMDGIVDTDDIKKGSSDGVIDAKGIMMGRLESVRNTEGVVLGAPDGTEFWTSIALGSSEIKRNSEGIAVIAT